MRELKEGDIVLYKCGPIFPDCMVGIVETEHVDYVKLKDVICIETKDDTARLIKYAHDTWDLDDIENRAYIITKEEYDNISIAYDIYLATRNKAVDMLKDIYIKSSRQPLLSGKYDWI